MEWLVVVAMVLACAAALPVCLDGECGVREVRAWDTETYDSWLYSDRCNIERVQMEDITAAEFEKAFVQAGRPVILMRPHRIAAFEKMTERAALLERFGHLRVVLSSANTFSYDKKEESLLTYVEEYMRPHTLDQKARETFYKFGDNHIAMDRELLVHYPRPPFADADEKGSLSFGFAGSGSGVPFHRHGHVFAEVTHGRKRWFLYPPEEDPAFDPDETTLRWVKNEYSELAEEKLPMECTLGPGEVIYLPDWWWHATLNIGETVFVSTFV